MKLTRIYDDTGSDDNFEIKDILFQDDDIIIATVFNEWYKYPFKVMIDKETKEVFGKNFNFYLAE